MTLVDIRSSLIVQRRRHDSLDEVVECTGVGAGAEAQDGLVGPFRADVRPVGGGRVDQSKFFERKICNEIILCTDCHSQSINANLEFRYSTPDTGAGFYFSVSYGAGGIGDISFASHTETFDASTGTNRIDGEVTGITFFFEALFHAFREREDGGRTSSDDIPRYRIWRIHGQRIFSRCFRRSSRRLGSRGGGFGRWGSLCGLRCLRSGRRTRREYEAGYDEGEH